MKREAAISAIIEYFTENEDIFNACIEDLDSYNGYLGNDRYYSMEELDDLYCDYKPSEILYRAFFGYDEDTWHTDAHGQKEYGPFNPNREYFRFNGYGNLVSADYKDYSAQLDKYAVEAMAEYLPMIDADDDFLADLFVDLEEANDEEEE